MSKSLILAKILTKLKMLLVSDEKIACTLDLSRQEATTRDESGLWLE
jgi:biotin operon repressor